MKTVTVAGKIGDLCGLYEDLRKASFSVVNVGAEMDKIHVYLEDGETKDPTPIVEAWIGRPKSEPATERRKLPGGSFLKKLLFWKKEKA